MAHYAILNEQNEVIEVIVGKDETDTETLPDNFNNWEEYYSNIKNKTVKRTSYNTRNNEHLNGGTAFRGNYAQIGGSYDSESDIFYPPKPFSSFVKDATIADWVGSVEKPDGDYWWNEETEAWEEYPAPPTE